MNKKLRTCMLSNKGGVGRTNAVIAIAGILADLHKEETLLVDLDPQGNLSFILNCEIKQEESKTSQVLLGKEVKSQNIAGFENLSIFTGSNDLKTEDVVRAFDNKLETALEDAPAHIICDTTSDVNHLVRQAINLCDTFLIITDIDKASIKGAISSAMMLDTWNKDNKKKSQKRYAFVINNFEKSTKFSNETLQTIESEFSDTSIFTVSKSQAVKNARRDGIVMTRYIKAKKTVNEFKKVTDWLLGE